MAGSESDKQQPVQHDIIQPSPVLSEDFAALDGDEDVELINNIENANSIGHTTATIERNDAVDASTTVVNASSSQLNDLKQTPAFQPASNLIKRPESKHSDIASGFTFAQAKKTPLNFSHGPKPPAEAQTRRESTPPSAQPQAEVNKTPDHSAQQSGPIQGPPFIPFPIVNVQPVASDKKQTRSSPSIGEQQDGGKPQSNVSAPRASPPRTENTNLETADTTVSPDTTLVAQDDSFDDSVNNHGHNQAVASAVKGLKVSKLAPAEVQRLKKPRSKRQPHTENHVTKYYEMNRQVQAELELALQEATLEIEDKEREIALLDQNLATLVQEYTTLQAKVQEQQNDTMKIAKVKKACKEKINEFKGVLQGLCNDHNSLRNQGQDLHTHTEDLVAEQRSIRETLDTATFANANSTERSQHLRGEYAREVQGLRDQVATLQQQLREKNAAPARDETEYLQIEAELAHLAQSYEELSSAYTNSHNEMNEKLDILLDKPDSVPVPTPSVAQPELRPILDECLGLIRQLLGREQVKPADFEKLEVAMQTYTTTVQDSILTFEQKSKEAATCEQKLASSVQKELDDLTRNLPTTKVLQEQVSEHREMKASISEQLNAAKLQLTEARCELNHLRQQEQQYSQTISSLQVEVSQARERREPPTEIMLKLHDLETLNRDLQSQKTEAEKKTEQVSKQWHSKNNEANTLIDQLSGLQLRLEDSRATEENLKAERADLERQLQTQRSLDELAAVQAEKARFACREDEFVDEKEQLSFQLQEARKEIERLQQLQPILTRQAEESREQAKQHVEQSEKEKEHEARRTNELQDKVVALQTDLDERERARKLAEDSLSRVSANMEDLNLRNQDLQAKINRAGHELEAKRIRIKNLERERKPEVKSPTKPQPAKSQYFQFASRTVEDSQPRELGDIIGVDESPSDRTINSDEDFSALFPPEQTFNSENDFTFERTDTSTSRTRVVSRGSDTTQIRPAARGRVIAEDSQERVRGVSPRKVQQVRAANQSRHLAPSSPARLNAGSQNGHLSASRRSNSQTKRSVSVAEFGAGQPIQPKRQRQDSQLSNLGPMINQQSPDHLLGGRGRKVSAEYRTRTQTKPRKEQQMSVRFQQERSKRR